MARTAGITCTPRSTLNIVACSKFASTFRAQVDKGGTTGCANETTFQDVYVSPRIRREMFGVNSWWSMRRITRPWSAVTSAEESRAHSSIARRSYDPCKMNASPRSLHPSHPRHGLSTIQPPAKSSVPVKRNTEFHLNPSSFRSRILPSIQHPPTPVGLFLFILYLYWNKGQRVDKNIYIEIAPPERGRQFPRATPFPSLAQKIYRERRKPFRGGMILVAPWTDAHQPNGLEPAFWRVEDAHPKRRAVTEGSDVFPDGRETSVVVSPVSDAENIPSMRRCGYVGFLLSASLFTSLSLPPSTVLAYPEQVTNDGHGITSRKLHPLPSTPPSECARPRLLDYTPRCERSFRRNTSLPSAETERSGFPR